MNRKMAMLSKVSPLGLLSGNTRTTAEFHLRRFQVLWWVLKPAWASQVSCKIFRWQDCRQSSQPRKCRVSACFKNFLTAAQTRWDCSQGVVESESVFKDTKDFLRNQTMVKVGVKNTKRLDIFVSIPCTLAVSGHFVLIVSRQRQL